MKVAAVLALLLLNIRLSHSCFAEGDILFCVYIPTAFPPGSPSLVLALRDAGEINSTALRSDELSSVTRLRIDSAGVTGIAEGAFSSFKNLTNLSLNQNLLTEINPQWLSRPEILSELSLTENQIEVLNESMLSGLSGLTKLSLNKNNIRAVDPNAFSSQTDLADLDLSDNQMTRLSPQVLRSLRSTRMRLDGNPWDCSCGAEDFADFLKDLHIRSLLVRPLDVTCESPAPLRGQPVWNVSACVTSPPARPPSATQTVQTKTTGLLPTVPPSTVVATRPSRPTSETETSVQPKPTDAPSHTATPPARPASETNPSIQPRPTDILTTTTTPPLKSETSVTPSASVMETSIHPKPSDLPTHTTESYATSRPSADTNIVCTLVLVFVVLSVLLCVVCFLVVLHRRKRHNKTVTPGRPQENRNEAKEEDGSSQSSPGLSEKRENNQWDSETGWRMRSFTGVRAKSAGAVLCTSPFCAPVRDRVTLKTETEAPSKDTEKRAEGEQKLRSETEVETENLTNLTDVNAAPAADKDPLCVSVNADTVPYLSIGTNQNKPDDLNKQSTDGPGQRLLMRKAMGRISTWPPTAAQWQARCKMMEKKEKQQQEEEEEEGADVFSASKFPGELNKVEPHSGSDQDKKDEDVERNQREDPLKINAGLTQSSKPDEKTTFVSEAHIHTDMKQEEQLKEEEMIQDPAATVRQTISDTQNLNQEKVGPNQKTCRKPAEKNSNKTEERNEPKRAATSRQRAENRSTQSSKAPSGGASPDDETLLSGNEYAFMDLLHEVVQNNGRWTRDRWRQIHANRQRR